MRYKSYIPNIFTGLNLSMGILAIIYMINGKDFIASSLILISVLLDRLDGYVARKLNAVSEFGKEFDSLCDLVSFGIAPSILIWKLLLNDSGIIGILIAILFSLAGACRLAKYNITEFDGFYNGIPITVCGGLMSLIAMIEITNHINTSLVMIIMIILSYGMVSKRIRLKKR